jgi:TFIIF-interacting CTD phosphatase-like protein
MERKNIFLDLDQTVISGEVTEDHDFSKYMEKSKLFQFEDMDGCYIIYERPGLQNFLDYLFMNFNVSVWTAASKDYALFIIENIIKRDKKRELDYVFFSYHCDLSKEKKNGTKDLSMIWDIWGITGYNSKNTFILDDYDEVHSTQPNNCLIAKPFEFTKKGSENDTFLESVKEKLEVIKLS